VSPSSASSFRSSELRQFIWSTFLLVRAAPNEVPMIGPKAYTRPTPTIVDCPKKLIGSRFQPSMLQVLRILWTSDEGQDIVEYAVMLAVILVVVIGTVRLIGGNANNVFSSVASNLQ
jgi:Flp pilus assembly pilin Flp